MEGTNPTDDILKHFLFGNNFKLMEGLQGMSSTKNTLTPFSQIYLLLTFFHVLYLYFLCVFAVDP